MKLTTNDLKLLLANWASIMQLERDKLIDLDSVVGDGDLGLTMSDGYTAAYDTIKDSDENDIGKFFYLAGKTMSTAVPSTMGTLMASGLIQVGKAFKGKTTIDTTEFALLFSNYFEGVQLRGKASVGEKTFLDGLAPAVKALENNANSEDWISLAEKALTSAKQGVEATKNMLAVHGRAATRGENSRTLLDPGAYVAMLLIKGYVYFAKSESV